jgi:predicted nucleic acid-binding Zn ribbon protein
MPERYISFFKLHKSLASAALHTNFPTMATYVYETIPSEPEEPVRTYEIQQSMKDDALTTHPDTGEPMRRIITGGLGIMTSGKSGGTSAPSGVHGCGASCGCG